MEEWQSKIYKSARWQKVRKQVIKRDKGICQKCHKLILKSPEVDHIEELSKSNYTNDIVAFNLDNLQTLCKECHNKKHGRFKKRECIVNDDLEIDYERRN